MRSVSEHTHQQGGEDLEQRTEMDNTMVCKKHITKKRNTQLRRDLRNIIKKEIINGQKKRLLESPSEKGHELRRAG